ncbi:MAG: PspC domain-containing protein [Flavobacteriales bacterium]|nr:PspC domain-containing protein [Flavobacteriales bacterium]MCB9196273.1 PspC domain-containing protein [Flavobacteriales bacterium]MCB9198834.1 PspC domain-containing protein [Flavobacteriales bacterium]
MNKTVNANIAGLVFYIEESAYDLLQNYLKNIEANFNNAEERMEIMRDVEARIAELFQQRNGDRKEVVNLDDVQEVISIMGKPEDYQSDEFEENLGGNNSTESSFGEEAYTAEKKLYRDEENAVIGGVCSGLAAYFGTDPVFVRIIFVLLVLFGFSGIFIYIILLFVIPGAKTTADKLKMRGAPITVESLKQTAKDLKDSVKDAADRNNLGKKISKTIDRSIRTTSKVGRMVSKFVGFGLLVGGLFLMVILISVFIGEGGLFPFWGERHSLTMSEAMDMLYITDIQSNLAYFSILLVLFIPIIGMISSGVKLLLDIRGSLKYMAIGSSVLWTLAFSILVITSIQMGLEFREEANVNENYTVNTTELNIEVADDEIFSNGISYSEHWENSDLIDVQEKGIYMGYPKLKIIESSKDSTFKIEIQKYARGLNYKEAILNAEEIQYEIEIVNNELILPAYLFIDHENKFRGHDVEIIVRVPEGHTVKLGDNIERILVPISEKNRESKERKSFENTVWKNDNNKMIFVDK